MPIRSSGTLTFLFTDIEGSTRRWQQDRAAMRATLARHDEVLRATIAARGGEVFKHTGDGVCAVFDSVPPAVSSAIDAQARLELPVRMGIHTGEAEHRDGDYFGPTLNRAARLMDAGHGGQILLSGVAAALLDDVVLTDLGEHRLRDLPRPERVWQVGTAIFPQLRVRSAFRTNLPKQFTSFVGRRTELTDLDKLFEHHPLVTLTGVGGTGKTRLAVQFGAEFMARFPDGVWMVELGRLRDPGAVTSSAASAMEVVPLPGQSALDRLVEYLGDRRALLILDNCEHLLDEVADLALALVEACPMLRLLATSRESMSVRGEQVYGVRSLATSGGDELSDAARLFLDRVREDRPDFELNDASRLSLDTICERLDGLPLAIELAAARAQVMGLREIAERLDERFRLLTGGRRGRVERHKTLRATVEWSYGLLSRAERAVFDRLSVFAATFDLEAAIAVCATGDVEEYEVLDHLGSLVAKSMVLVEEHPQLGARYRLLETLRAFGHEQLERGGSLHDVRCRHAEHAIVSTRSTISAYWGSGWRLAVPRLEVDRADLHVAMVWLLAAGRVDDALAPAIDIAQAWEATDSFVHATLEAVITDPQFAACSRRSAALGALAILTWSREADLHRAERIALESIAARHSPTEFEHVYNSAELALACVETMRGHLDAGAGWAQRLVDLGDGERPHNKTVGLLMGSFAKSMQGRHDEGLAMALELERHAASHPPWCPGYLVNHAMGFAYMASDPDRALHHFDQAMRAAREGGSARFARVVAGEFLSLAIERVDEQATSMTRDVICDIWEMRDLGNLVRVVSHSVVLCARAGRFAEGAAIDGWIGDRFHGVFEQDRVRYAVARAAIDEHLGTEADRHRAVGASWTSPIAIDHILAALDEIAAGSLESR